MNNISKIKKSKIICLFVLLLAFGVITLAMTALGGWSKSTGTGIAEVNAASAASMIPDINVASTEPMAAPDGNEAGIGISPTGWWEDLWKIAEEIDVYGTLHAGDKYTTVSSGSYTNKAYGYTAPDDFPQFQYSKDNKNWTTVDGTHSMFSTSNEDGWRYYRGYKPDPKGDYSKVSTICLETVKPQLQIKLNGSSIANGTITALSGSYFSMLATDDVSGVASYWYKTNNGSYSQVSAGTHFYGDAVYSFYVKDYAGNVSDTITVTRDTSAPTVGAYNSASSKLSNGAHASTSSVTFSASDSTTSVSYIYIRTPGSSYYSAYSSTSVTLSSEGLYYYYASDRAGNYSSTYSVTVDRTKPTAYLYSGTTSVSSGYYSAASYIRFTASDTNGCTVYMRKDSGSYGVYTSGTSLTVEGVYSFYAVDPAGNSTSTYTITLDRTAPVGTLYAGTTVVSSGKITNASYIRYTATDNLALSTLYVRTPGASSYVSFTSGTQYTTDGTYYFYATDKSGNASSTVSVVLDRTKPVATITAGTATIASGGYTNSSSVKFSASDATSGVANMYVRLPGMSNYISYVAGTPFTAEGLYYFYATDVAGNTGDTVNVTLDITKPTGTLNSNGSALTSGSFTNKAFYYTAADSLSGVAKCEIKRPGSSTWEAYNSGSSIAATSANGLYSFRSTDRAGNVSVESQVNLVTVPPATTLYAGSNIVPSGTFTNSSYISFIATGSLGSTASLYVKMPSSSSFTSYTSGTQFTKEGLYSFYATDNAGNISSTLNITLDVTKPVGTLTANGVTVESGSFINKAFSFTATDGVSGIAKCEIKRPNGVWEAYTSGTLIAASNANGLYSFRSTDKAGNVSLESQINLVTAAPSVTLYAGASTVSSGSITNKSYVAFTVTAYSNATASLYVKMPGASSFILYAAGTQLSKEGKYEVYAADNAGNISATLNLTLDISTPTGTITVGGAAVSSGDFVNSAFKYTATDSVSGIAKLEILRPGGTWKTYGGEEIAAGSGDGWYSFRATDNAGNLSAESNVYLLTAIPSVQLYADEYFVANGTYTNLARISMSASGGTDLACYVKTPGASGFSAYNQYYTYSTAGRYEFYAQDQAGNKSSIFVIIIDRTAKPIALDGVSDGLATGDVSLSWQNSNTDMVAPIVSVTINGLLYNHGSIVKTIDGGVYFVKSIDAAGNEWSTTFTAARIDVISATLNKQYWECKDSAGKAYAFASYESALAFAKEREMLYVRTGTWNGSVWDIGIAMDAKDSVNAVQGTYYIYKKSGNSNEEVAYFTQERLYEVLSEHAAIGIESYYYWEKDPTVIFDGENLYSYSDARTILANSIALSGNAGYMIDGELFTGNEYDVEGQHILTVFDEWGNTCDYMLIVIRRAPDIYYALDGGTKNLVTFDRIYHLNAIVTVSIGDEYDEFAMFNIFSENGKNIACLSLGSSYTFDKSGRYTVQAVNHFGESQIFTLIISLDPPKVQIVENTVEKKLEITITKSTDAHSHLQTLEIYKSVDGGKTWMLISVDDYESAVSLSRMLYAFRTSGLYKVVLTDEFRTGIDAVTVQFDYTQEEPDGILSGVENGGYTSGIVSFTWTDEAVVRLEKDGVVISYISGQELTEDGSYVITFENFDGYKVVYSFVIDTVMPEVSVNGAENDSTVNKDVSVSWDEEELTAELYKNGELVGIYKSGALLTEDGTYSIVVSDLAKNAAVINFVIDKTVDFTINVNDKGLANSVTANAKEELKAVLTKDGEVVSYVFGDSITSIGEYVLIITDETGNSEEISFSIVKALVQSFVYNFDGIPNLETIMVNGVETRLNYGTLELKSCGTYEIGVIVDGVSYNFTVVVDSAVPTLVLSGVENGGTTKGSVTLSDASEEAAVKVFLNDTEIEYELGGKLSQTGKYRVVVQDQCGNISEYTFEIAQSINGGVIALIVIVIIAVIGGGVFFFLKKRKKI